MKIEKLKEDLFLIQLKCKKCRKESEYNLIKTIYLPNKLKVRCKNCDEILTEDIPDDILEVGLDLNGDVYIK